jgi:hypothetical protein
MSVRETYRQTMQAPKGLVVDHINGDRSDNRPENLRVCSISANSRNWAGMLATQKEFCGVYRADSLWEVSTCHDGLVTVHGRYEDLSEANRVYLANYGKEMCSCTTRAKTDSEKELDPKRATYQRLYKETRDKLKAIAAAHRPEVSVPALLADLTDRELEKYPQLKKGNE